MRGNGVTSAEPPSTPPPPLPPELDRFFPGSRTVRVLDEQGRPIAGALVHPPWASRGKAHRTDAEGRAPTGRLGGGHGTPTQFRCSWTVVIRAEGYAPHEHYCRAHSGQEEIVTLRTRGHTVAGCCVDASGVGIAGVRLALEGTGPRIEAVSGAHGHFRIESAPPGIGTLEARAEGRVADPLRVVPPDADLVVRLFEPAHLRGRLDLEPKCARRLLERMCVKPAPRKWKVDDGGQSFAAVCVPGRVRLELGRWTLAVLELREGETMDLGVVDPERAVAERPLRARADREPPPYVDLDFQEFGRIELSVDGCFEDLGVVHLDYVRSYDETRLELPSKRLVWLGFLTTDAATCWRQVACVGEAVRIHIPNLVPVRCDALRSKGEHVATGGIHLRWGGSVHHAYAIRKASRGVGAGIYDVVWRPSYHGETVVLQRGVVVDEVATAIDLGVLEVPPPVELVVRVEERFGMPVPSAVVTLERGRDTLALRTDAEGRAVFRLRDPTALRLTAESPGHTPKSMRLPVFDASGSVTLRFAE